MNMNVETFYKVIDIYTVIAFQSNFLNICSYIKN